MDENEIHELLKTKGRFLFHKESQRLEYKEQFNLAGLAEYFKDFAAFSNNRGGFMVFGVQDSPRLPAGMSEKSLASFNKIDPEKITGYLLEIFSSNINWEQYVVEAHGKSFGIFHITEADVKPIIAKKDEGKDQVIKNGEIYYRYGGRTQKILFAELENIIFNRVDENNKSWMSLVKQIGTAGPQNAVVLETKKMLSNKGKTGTLVVDEKLAKKLKFIKQGEFDEKRGATALKLVGDVVPINKVEVEKVIKENLTSTYPLSATELAQAVMKRLPKVGQHSVWRAITANEMKGNPSYSAYKFRNKRQEDQFEKTGKVQNSIPCIFNKDAVDLLVKVLEPN